MKCHLIYKCDHTEEYTPTVQLEERAIVISGEDHFIDRFVRNNVLSNLNSHQLDPPDITVDLLRLALAVYTADTRIPRSSAADHWKREFVLHIPVSRVKPWKNCQSDLERTLSFLTGDKWTLKVRRGQKGDLGLRRRNDGVDAVCLFSGGLDSYSGAYSLLEGGKRLSLVGHYADGATSTPQTIAYKSLERFGDRASLLQYFVSPAKSVTGCEEKTLRGRSFLFLSLGILTASCFDNDPPLVVPENGFISLNVPLTNARTGSLSTRTTHPLFMYCFMGLLKTLNIENSIELPYAFHTKGELIKEHATKEDYVAGCAQTMSCAHPAAARWRGGRASQHCGYCIPCIIRRASMEFAGIDRVSDYLVDVRKEKPSPKKGMGRDLRALGLALNRTAAFSDSDFAFAVMDSGSLPREMGTISDFASVYRRGLDELRRFVKPKKRKA